MENNVENQQKDFNTQEMQKEEKQGRILYGGFWARLAAHFIDGFIINIASIPLGLLSLSRFYSITYGDELSEVFFDLVGGLIGLGIGFGYYVYMTYKYQATLGKMAIGVRVLNEKGEKPTLSEVVIREVLGKIVSGLTLGIGYLIVAFTNKKQALHDMIGKTIVVAKDQKNGTNKVVVILVNACIIGFILIVLSLFISYF